ncbi:hypothetical protein F0562_006138 [Nyssa sinensis]|uniref:Uncharacterized protein n=1 Tax=Nyssa sinensis TaxID=561372 RepID=A0A5J5AMQ4_9ASTE|nr:hypothetical protein F0562_006138 [Nyssa sinensis]
MEKKRNDYKFSSTTCQEANETNDLSCKEDQNQPGGGKNATIGSSSHENAPSLNQQFQPIVQWPYTTQPAVEQSPLISKPCIPDQSASPIILSMWQQSQHQQPNPTAQQFQQNQPPPHLVQSAMPFWLPQRPAYHLAGTNVPCSYNPFTPVGTSDVNWQGPSITGGGISAINQPQIPSFCYHVGYPYPGPWDPSSWWGQPQTPSTYTFPGACNYFSSPSQPVSGCSAAAAESFQKGIIRPPPKLSQKHQQLWEAQSAENVQLWAVVGHLQSELADYKSRLMKLEADILSLKSTAEEPAAHGTGTSLAGLPSKRGRPKRAIASVNVLPSPEEFRSRARVRKPAPCNAQYEARELNFEKVCLSKVEDKEKAFNSIANIHQVKGDKNATVYTNNSGNNQISGSGPAFDNHIPGLQISGVGLNSSDLIRSDDKTEDSKAAFSFLTQHVKGIESKDASASYVGTINNGNFGWPSNIPLQDCGRGLLNISCQSFYNDGSVTGQGEKSGWSFVNGDDSSISLANAAVGSPKDKDEETEDDDISGAEDIA